MNIAIKAEYRVKYPAAGCVVFDPCGSRQMDMQACPLGSLLAGINYIKKDRVEIWNLKLLLFPETELARR